MHLRYGLSDGGARSGRRAPAARGPPGARPVRGSFGSYADEPTRAAYGRYGAPGGYDYERGRPTETGTGTGAHAGHQQEGGRRIDRAQLIESLCRIVGQHHVIHRLEQLLVYETDGLTAFHQMPEVVVLPETTDQVSGVLRFCYRNGVPFVPRGKGTGLSCGALPVEGAVVISTECMRRIPYGRWIVGAQMLPSIDGDRYGTRPQREQAARALHQLAMTAGQNGALADQPVSTTSSGSCARPCPAPRWPRGTCWLRHRQTLSPTLPRD